MTAVDIGALRQQAAQAQAAGDFKGAEAAWRSVLAAEPNNIYGLMGLGSVARAAKDLKEAELRYKAASAAHPRSGWPWFTLVSLYADMKDWAAGEAAAQHVLSTSKHPSDLFHTWLALGQLRRAQGRQPEALEAFRSALAADPANVGIRLEIGRSLVTLERLDEARQCYLDAVDRAPPDRQPGVFRSLAALERKVGDRPAAVRWLERAALLQPGDTALAGELAAEAVALAKASGDKAAIRAAAEKAYALAPGHVPTMIELATAYRDSGDVGLVERAGCIYGDVLKAAPEHLSALLGLGAIARREGDYDAALKFYSRAQVAHPKNSWARIEVGKSLNHLLRFDEADAMLREVPAEDLHHRHALNSRADVARARGDGAASVRLRLEAAVHAPDPVAAMAGAAQEALQFRDFDAARKIAADIAARDPQSLQAAMIEGRACRAVLDRQGAHDAFARAAALGPDKAAPLVELATECLALGQTAAADRHIARALELEPDNLQALLHRGERLRALRDDAGAAEVFARARKAHPAQPWPYLNGAQVLAGRGDLDAALSLIADGRAACPPSAAFFAREANILQEAGHLDRARDLLAEGHAAFPNDGWLWGSRVGLATITGDFALAEQLIAAPPGVAVTDQARTLVARARIEEARWRLPVARALLQQAAALDPTNATAANELAKLALFRFDLDDARRWLTRHMQLQAASARSPNITQSQLGQIYDEFMIEPDLVLRLSVLSVAPTPASIADIAGIVAAHPDSTAAAIALMIALRRTGAFDAAPPSGDAAAIPRTISQFWDSGAPPPDVGAMIDGWIAAHPGWRHTLYDDRSAAAYLAGHAPAEALAAFRRSRDRAQRADIFRLARLHAEGGVYVDADDRCRGALEQIVPAGYGLVAFQEDYGSIANNFLAVTPGHPVIGRALELAAASVNRGDLEIVWLSTGPGLLTRALAAILAERGGDIAAGLAGIRILDRHEVRASLVPYCHAGYKRTSRHWQNAAFAVKAADKGAAPRAG